MGSLRFAVLAFRLGLFQACLGALSVLTLGIFNRLLIDEFAVPAALTALALGAQQLVAVIPFPCGAGKGIAAQPAPSQAQQALG